MKALCNRAKEILQEESNVCHVSSPVTVSYSFLLPSMAIFVDEEILIHSRKPNRLNFVSIIRFVATFMDSSMT